MNDIPKFDQIGNKIGDVLAGYYSKTNGFGNIATIKAQHMKLNVKISDADSNIKGQMESIDGQTVRLGLIASQKWSNTIETKMKWISDHVVFGEIAFNNQLLQGSRLSFTGRLDVGKGNGLGVAGQYQLKHQRFRLDLSASQEQDKFIANQSAVFR